MAAASPFTFNRFASPSPNFTQYGARPHAALSRLSSSSSQPQFGALATRRLGLSRRSLTFGRRMHRVGSVFASYDESAHREIEVDKEKDDLKMEPKEVQEAWKQALESFKTEALKMKEISEKAYDEYSKKAIVVLQETSVTLKIQAEKAKQDLSVIAKQINEEGKVYLSEAAKKSPDSIKDVVETFAYSTDELKELPAVRDFYLGIPYGAFLSIGGFLAFMLTGSISAIRFGVILGSALLALSVSSLRLWRRGESSELYLNGQAAIAAIIFIRECRLFFRGRSFSTALMALISGAMAAFYVYRIMIDDGSSSSRGPRSSEQHATED